MSPSADAGGGIGFEVDDVDAMVAALRAKGTTVKLEPFSTFVCRMAVVLDSEGNAVTLHQVTQDWWFASRQRASLSRPMLSFP